MLVHNKSDITVPVANTENLYKFLKDNGAENVELQMAKWGSMFGQPAHETGALMFATYAIEKVTNILHIKVWFNIVDVMTDLL